MPCNWPGQLTETCRTSKVGNGSAGGIASAVHVRYACRRSSGALHDCIIVMHHCHASCIVSLPCSIAMHHCTASLPCIIAMTHALHHCHDCTQKHIDSVHGLWHEATNHHQQTNNPTNQQSNKPTIQQTNKPTNHNGFGMRQQTITYNVNNGYNRGWIWVVWLTGCWLLSASHNQFHELINGATGSWGTMASCYLSSTSVTHKKNVYVCALFLDKSRHTRLAHLGTHAHTLALTHTHTHTPRNHLNYRWRWCTDMPATSYYR